MRIASSTDRETRGIWKAFSRGPGPVERMIDFLAGRIFLLIVVKDQIRHILGLPRAFTSIYLRVGKIPRLPRRPGGCGGCRDLDLHIAREHGVQRCAGGTACEGIWQVFRIGRSSCPATDSISRLCALIRLAFSMRPTAFVTRSTVSKIDTKTRISRSTGERGMYTTIGRSTHS